mgnify:CR=1 FL=1
MSAFLSNLENNFRKLLPKVDFCSLRIVHNRNENISVNRGILHPPYQNSDSGAMVTILDKGGLGYAATSEITLTGLKQALQQAHEWAHISANHSLVDHPVSRQQNFNGHYSTPVQQPWSTLPLTDKVDLLQQQSRQLKLDKRIRDWNAALHYTATQTTYLDSDGVRIEQQIQSLAPMLSVTAYDKGESQNRSFGGDAFLRQGGM